MKMLVPFAVLIAALTAAATDAQRFYAGPEIAWDSAGVAMRQPLFFRVDPLVKDDLDRLIRWRGSPARDGIFRHWFVTVRVHPGDADAAATKQRWRPALEAAGRELIDHGTLRVGDLDWLFFESRPKDTAPDARAPVAFTALAAISRTRIVEVRAESTQPTPIDACRRFALDLLVHVRETGDRPGRRTWLAPARASVRFPAGWTIENAAKKESTRRATSRDGDVVTAVAVVRSDAVADAVRSRAGKRLIAAPEPLEAGDGVEAVIAGITRNDVFAGIRIGDSVVIVQVVTKEDRPAEPLAIATIRTAAVFDPDEERKALLRTRSAFDAALKARPFDGPVALAQVAEIADRLDAPGANIAVRKALGARPLVAEAVAHALAQRPAESMFGELKRTIPNLVRRKRHATLATVLRGIAASGHGQSAAVLERQLEHPHPAVVFAAIEGLHRASVKPLRTFPIIASFWAGLERTAAARPQAKPAIAYVEIRASATALLARLASRPFDTPADALTWFNANRRKLR